VPDWVAQVHHERVQIVGQAASGGGEPFFVELVCERIQATLGVPFADRLIQGLPVGALDTFALPVRQLGVQIPGAVHAAALAV
jgi:hypothetical protein